MATVVGHWQLDRQASDDVRAMLLPRFERNDRRWRRDAERFDVPPPGVEPAVGQQEGISNLRWLEQERRKEVQALIAFVSPATEIDIDTSGASVRMATNKGEGTRVLTPGETSSWFHTLGGFEVTSGWDKRAFVIDARGTGDNRMRMIERYIPSGDRLEKQVEVKIPGLGKQAFKAVYKR